MKHLFTALLLSFFMFTGIAFADTLILPANTRVIEAEAFYDNRNLDKVIIPEGCKTIKTRAFANSSLKTIQLPDSLTYIANDALPNSVHVIASPSSYAYQWATNMNLIGFSVEISQTPQVLVGGVTPSSSDVKILADHDRVGVGESFSLQWNAKGANMAVLWRRTRYGQYETMGEVPPVKSAYSVHENRNGEYVYVLMALYGEQWVQSNDAVVTVGSGEGVKYTGADIQIAARSQADKYYLNWNASFAEECALFVRPANGSYSSLGSVETTATQYRIYPDYPGEWVYVLMARVGCEWLQSADAIIIATDNSPIESGKLLIDRTNISTTDNFTLRWNFENADSCVLYVRPEDGEYINLGYVPTKSSEYLLSPRGSGTWIYVMMSLINGEWKQSNDAIITVSNDDPYHLKYRLIDNDSLLPVPDANINVYALVSADEPTYVLWYTLKTDSEGRFDFTLPGSFDSYFMEIDKDGYVYTAMDCITYSMDVYEDIEMDPEWWENNPYELKYRLIDRETDRPIPDAEVRVYAPASVLNPTYVEWYIIYTDSKGLFKFTLPKSCDCFYMEIKKEGYIDIDIEFDTYNNNNYVDMEMDPAWWENDPYELKYKVIDEITRKPISGADVVISAAASEYSPNYVEWYSLKTDSKGQFDFILPKYCDSFLLEITKDGYVFIDSDLDTYSTQGYEIIEMYPEEL